MKNDFNALHLSYNIEKILLVFKNRLYRFK